MARRIRKKASLTNVSEPQLVTLTKTPANRSGFKIMRNADSGLSGESEVERAEDFLVSIELPDGISEEQATLIRDEYGMADMYTLTKRETQYWLVRNDAEDEESCVSVPLSGGQVAHVAPAAFQRSEDFVVNESDIKWPDGDAKASIRLVSLRFDRAVFPDAVSVDLWLQANKIDYPASGVEQSEDAFAVTRSEADDDTRDVVFAEGVTGTICRADALDFPYALYGRTVEEAYGQWGWGQLDFNAMMADIAFTDQSVDAIYHLRSVLDNIVIDSELPLDTRKQLIVNAVSSYAAYQIGLIDALPRAVIEQTRSDEQPTGQENDMSKEAKTAAESEGVDTEVERSEAEAVETTEEQVTEQAAEEQTEQEFVTRSDLEEIVAGAVAKALEAAQPAEEQVERSEETAEEATSGEDKLDKLMGAVTNIAGAVKGLGEETAALRTEFEEAEGRTVVARSTVESETTETKRSEDLTPDMPEFWSGAVSLSK